ncbi:MAG TPA: PTS sugar transporter subunit IIA [Spirochaetota bacterium]|nr:PTS sugar transporter subunit IIA [Spirochaetota bacterium]HPW51321.1 PTS sugar transporter subunit IIA [Spirochaetota bacterium]HQO22564.1 PTS sugar transporter subunit IIA [Spirochaetota bacterium]HQQ23774.1 PTS sugar transporter subunit IIA [Spirochaetota bacterium]
MILIESLFPDTIVTDYKPSNRWDIIKYLVNLLVKNGQLSAELADSITKALVEREKSMSTGIGKGIAIPHCVIDQIEEPKIAMAILPKGINFEAIDDEPVQIIILLLSPKSKMQLHVKNLAAIAKFMNNDQLKDKLISLKDSSEIKKFITDNCANVK